MSRDWFERFCALQVEVHTTQANDDVTVLQGRVIDQAQLSGILNTLYELHMSLLAVKSLGDKPSSN